MEIFKKKIKEIEVYPRHHITLEEFAKILSVEGLLDGLLNGFYIDLAKKNGIVMAYCTNEDIAGLYVGSEEAKNNGTLILVGAINDGLFCKNEGIRFIDKDGIIRSGIYEESYIRTVKNRNDAASGPDEQKVTWLLETNIPHETFTFQGKTECGEASCRGIIFNINDLHYERKKVTL